jgi:ABC-2 type transport system ATP-binding protein
MTAGSVITVEELHKTYGSVHALNGLSLSVRQGEFFGILGPNGAGKTTLIEILEGLRQATSGTVSVLGQSPWPRNRKLLPRIGLQTQSSAFFTRLTAGEHLATVAALYGSGDQAAAETLALVGLTEQAGTPVEQLSGGQRQRLAIAGALTHQPELLFLDEPTAALDPEARRALWDVLRDIKSHGRTIIYTTHHLDEAETLCDRVAIIRDGELVALDDPRTLIRGLGAPTRVLVPAEKLTLEAARTVPGVEDAVLLGDSTVLTTSSVAKVLAELDRITDISDVQTRTATLEDVYLHLAGTEYQA